MSNRTRGYVHGDSPMYRAAAYDTETEHLIRVAGPYSTRGAAMRQRRGMYRPGRRVVVEVCTPTWVEVDDTELAGPEVAR